MVSDDDSDDGAIVAVEDAENSSEVSVALVSYLTWAPCSINA